MVRLSLGDVWFGLVIVSVAVATGISVASLGPDLRPRPDVVEGREGVRNGGASKREESAAHGYSFGYPPGWRARNAGAVTKVSSPRRRIVVSVGPGPEGSLRQASRTFIALVRKQYENVRVLRRARVSLEGRTAFVSSGTATTERGFRIRMVALALSDRGHPYLIAGFSDAHVVESKLGERVRTIARSLRRSEPG